MLVMNVEHRPIRPSLSQLGLESRRSCVVYIYTVFIKSITARYGVRLFDKTGKLCLSWQCPQCSVFGSLLLFLCTSELFSILENKDIGYADDSTLITVVPSPDVRVRVAESLNRDRGMVIEG